MKVADLSDSVLLKQIFLTYKAEFPNSESELEKQYMSLLKIEPLFLAKQLKAIRTEKGFSQEDIAQQLNVKQASLSAWELGVRIPKIKYVKALIDIYNIDPGALLKKNPNFIEPLNSLPILDSNFFIHQSFENIESILKKHSFDKTISSSYSNECNFAFAVQDNSMEPLFPKGSIAICSTEELKGKEKEEQLIIANNKYAIVNITGQEGRLRKIKYENRVLSLIPLNKDEPFYNFPESEEFEKFVTDKNSMYFHGYITSSASVRIFGIAKFVFFDLNNI